MVHLREAFVSGLALITIPDRRFDRPMTADLWPGPCSPKGKKPIGRPRD